MTTVKQLVEKKRILLQELREYKEASDLLQDYNSKHLTDKITELETEILSIEDKRFTFQGAFYKIANLTKIQKELSELEKTLDLLTKELKPNSIVIQHLTNQKETTTTLLEKLLNTDLPEYGSFFEDPF